MQPVFNLANIIRWKGNIISPFVVWCVSLSPAEGDIVSHMSHCEIYFAIYPKQQWWQWEILDRFGTEIWKLYLFV